MSTVRRHEYICAACGFAIRNGDAGARMIGVDTRDKETKRPVGTAVVAVHRWAVECLDPARRTELLGRGAG